MDFLLELVELERTVVLRAWEAEAVVHELLLASLVAVEHGAYLRHGDDRGKIPMNI